MKPRDHDYAMFLALISFWLMFLCLEQCSTREAIQRELQDISHELRMMRYN